MVIRSGKTDNYGNSDGTLQWVDDLSRMLMKHGAFPISVTNPKTDGKFYYLMAFLHIDS